MQRSRLRERLSKLGGLDLLRGARRIGELERLQRQLDRIEAEPTDEDLDEGRPRPARGSPVHARLRRADPGRLVRAARRPRPRRRLRARHRLRQARGSDDCADRPPEGPGHQGANAAELRHSLYPEGYRKAMRVMGSPTGTAFRSLRWSTLPVPTLGSPPSSTARVARSRARRRRWRGSPFRPSRS